jgi:uncharacterized phage protein (TIGR02218 family)
MKSITAALQAHFGLDTTTLAVLWKITRADGTVMGFTTHDQDISYQAADDTSPVTYLAETGLSNTASDSSSDLSVDNAEVTGFIESASITVADIRAGVYDNALIEERVVNWANLSMGDMLVRSGWLGKVQMKNGLFTVELRGLTQKLSTAIGSTYGPVCRAELGSSMAADDGSWRPWYCNVNLAAYQQSGSVSSSPDAMTLIPASGLQNVGSSPVVAAPASWFDNGSITFTSGVLAGKTFEIKTWDGTALDMFLPFPEQPQAGDTFTITPGCDQTASATGCLKFNNIANFRGEPFTPGADLILNYPNASP